MLVMNDTKSCIQYFSSANNKIGTILSKTNIILKKIYLRRILFMSS